MRINIRRRFTHYGCVYHPVVLNTREGFRMYFRGGNNFQDRIFTAVSKDGIIWDEEDAIKLDLERFNLLAVSSCAIVSTPDILRMYLSGDNGEGWQIYSAISRDYLYWKMEEGVRIPKGDGFDPDFAKDPTVIKNKDCLRMYYLAGDGKYNRILGAVSFDGLNWEKIGVCIEPVSGEHSKSIKTPFVYSLNDGSLRMYFAGGSEYPILHSSILSAISSDGKNWKREEGARIGYDRNLDICEVLSPFIVADGNMLRMYYAGVGFHFLYPLTYFRYAKQKKL